MYLKLLIIKIILNLFLALNIYLNIYYSISHKSIIREQLLFQWSFKRSRRRCCLG